MRQSMSKLADLCSLLDGRLIHVIEVYAVLELLSAEIFRQALQQIRAWCSPLVPQVHSDTAVQHLRRSD
jgi:hypothetical protein